MSDKLGFDQAGATVIDGSRTICSGPGKKPEFPPHAVVKICGRCGADFLCGPQKDNGDCWCDRLPNIIPLDANKLSCLCPDCLGKLIEKKLEGR